MKKIDKGSIIGEQKVKSLNGRWYFTKKKYIRDKPKVIKSVSIISISPDLNKTFVVAAVYSYNGTKWNMSVAGDNPYYTMIEKEAKKYSLKLGKYCCL